MTNSSKAPARLHRALDRVMDGKKSDDPPESALRFLHLWGRQLGGSWHDYGTIPNASEAMALVHKMERKHPGYKFKASSDIPAEAKDTEEKPLKSCKRCKGTGAVQYGQGAESVINCPTCHGTGCEDWKEAERRWATAKAKDAGPPKVYVDCVDTQVLAV